LTDREKEILSIIRENPQISQKEIANILGIKRSSVAVHITNLTRKGYIKGKGYVLIEKPYITVIGGANIDIQGFVKENLVLEDSNPGRINMSLGGVGRNIAENIVKLGIDTKLISVLGDDIYGEKILRECIMAGIDMENSLVLNNVTSSTYLSILDKDGDMKVAISDMDILDMMTIDFAQQKNNIIKNSKLVVVDTNIPIEVMEYLLSNHKDTVFFLDTVSTKKALKIKDIIGCFHTIKPNKMEAEILTGIKINKDEDLERSAEYLLNKGVKRVFISLGKNGVYFKDGNTSGRIIPPKIEVINATGAGDAFIAALVYSYINNYDIEYSGRFATTASILALSDERTINPKMSIERIVNKMKELKI